MTEETQKEKETRARSRLYPRYDLEEAIKFIESVNKLGGNKVSAHAVAADMGKAVNNSSLTGRLSSAKQFGLLVQDEGKLSVSSLGKEIIFPRGEEEKSGAIQIAFAAPTLYRELIADFSGKILPDKATLGNRLIHDYSIEAAAKDVAAKNFIQSAEYAGVVRNNILIAQVTSNPNQDKDAGAKDVQQNNSYGITTKHSPQLPASDSSNTFSFEFAGGICLIIPKNQKTSDAIADGELKDIRKALSDFAEKFVEEHIEKSEDKKL